MGVPSVSKFTKDGVEFTSSVDRANYYIDELTRAAMKDVGRFIMKQCSSEVKGINRFLRRARYATRRYQYWVRKKENDLIVGVENTKYGADTAWWADQSELGTEKQPKRGILRNAVYNNIDKIREIEAQYLSAIEDEMKAQSLIDEGEEEGAADG